MAQLTGCIISHDDGFQKQIGRMLRSGAVPVSVAEERSLRDGVSPDIIVVDLRSDAPAALAAIERYRANVANVGIFAVASVADPDLILQAMRAGANEFFIWPPPEDTFGGAVRKIAARRDAAQGTKPAATTLVFFGAKGRAG